ncbi:GNAT family N-acetyltransferase [Streptomyces avicenniae]|uniref:GNAT family N-acetyltransferase n=1 Tax=Streptomyces avicenniae TaxID=500153 RepID=UPI00069A4027|nr:GNAT family N-acetyltransferase [Streptomyces avicenniae]
MTGPRTDPPADDLVPGPPVPLLPDGWTARPARAVGEDLDTVHRWMTRAHVAAFWHQDWPRERWADELATQRAGNHSLPCLVGRDGTPLAYIEVYRVARDRLAGHYPCHPRDLGVHIAIGDADRLGRGLGRGLLRDIADGLFAADRHCTRVVAEPDELNTASIRAFKAAGYAFAGRITLPEKTAELLIRTRDGSGPP